MPKCTKDEIGFGWTGTPGRIPQADVPRLAMSDALARWTGKIREFLDWEVGLTSEDANRANIAYQPYGRWRTYNTRRLEN